MITILEQTIKYPTQGAAEIFDGFAKVLGLIDDCKGNFILLIHEIENNAGASHGISDWVPVAYSMTCESVEFD